MNILKFECPSCEQRLECNRVCSGDIIHCPRCCAEIRIPFPNTAYVDGTIARAELISAGNNQQQSAATTPVQAQADLQPAGPKEVLCPVCHSELRVPEAPPAGVVVPKAELLKKGAEAVSVPTPIKDGKPAVEMKIAKAQKQEETSEHRGGAVEAHPPIKPRSQPITAKSNQSDRGEANSTRSLSE